MREYGIDLAEQMAGMSWRRFLCLASHLSPFGAVALEAAALRQEGTEDDRSQAAAFFAEAMGR